MVMISSNIKAGFTMKIFNKIKQIMPSSIKKIVYKFYFKTNAGRNLTVFDDDIFIVSYPKSGNTWTRFLIANLYYSNVEITFLNIENKVPDIYQNTNKFLLKLARPRILKSHECFDKRYKRVIFIVRDPRDVAVSYYHYMVKCRLISEDYSISLFLKRFLDGDLDSFMSWGDNICSWLEAKDESKNFLLIRYEDLLNDAHNEMKKISSFLGVVASDDIVKRAVELSSFDKMRSLETAQSEIWQAISNSRLDKSFIRSGKSGSWNSLLSQEQAQLILDKWPKLMEQLGYK